MTRTILDLIKRDTTPTPWSEGDNIPWNDPAFSERMLAEHLSQEHDLASRRADNIDLHVDWIFTQVLGSQSCCVLDLACGPGLYLSRLAQRGCVGVGIDFSPASIAHARAVASQHNYGCTYQQNDVRSADLGRDFDLAMMVYGQFNVFPRDVGLELLHRVQACLKPGGALVLEIQSAQQIEQAGQSAASWYTAESGLFSSKPHLVLQENFWHAEQRSSTMRFYVVDGASGEVTQHALSNEAYTEEELTQALHAAGFTQVDGYPCFGGESGDDALPVVVARK